MPRQILASTVCVALLHGWACAPAAPTLEPQEAIESFDAHYGIGRALDLAGQYDEGRRHFARAIELAPQRR